MKGIFSKLFELSEKVSVILTNQKIPVFEVEYSHLKKPQNFNKIIKRLCTLIQKCKKKKKSKKVEVSKFDKSVS